MVFSFPNPWHGLHLWVILWCVPIERYWRYKIGDLTLPTIWSAAEACLGIVAACLPTFRPLFRKSRTPDHSQTNHSSSSKGLSSKILRRSFSTNQNFLQLQDFSAKGTTLRLQALPDNSTSGLVDSSTEVLSTWIRLSCHPDSATYPLTQSLTRSPTPSWLGHLPLVSIATPSPLLFPISYTFLMYISLCVATAFCTFRICKPHKPI